MLNVEIGKKLSNTCSKHVILGALGRKYFQLLAKQIEMYLFLAVRVACSTNIFKP